MNQTLADLRTLLGPPARFVLDAEPTRRRNAVTASVRWPCGCCATGASYRRLTLEPCRAHAEPRAASRPLAGLFTFLAR